MGLCVYEVAVVMMVVVEGRWVGGGCSGNDLITKLKICVQRFPSNEKQILDKT